MLRIIKNSLIIAIPYSIVVGAIVFIVSTRFVAVFEETTQIRYEGWEAIEYLIESQGYIEYFMSNAFDILGVFVIVFVALVIQGLAFYRHRDA